MVDLPAPLRPRIPTFSPLRDVQIDVIEDPHATMTGVVEFGDVDESDHSGTTVRLIFRNCAIAEEQENRIAQRHVLQIIMSVDLAAEIPFPHVFDPMHHGQI